MRSRLRTLIFTQVDHTARRQIIHGVGRYARQNHRWQTLIPWADLDDWTLPRNLKIDGVIAFPSLRREMDFLLRLKMPVVCVGPHFQNENLPRIDWDDRMAGRLAVEHLIECGLKHIAFVGADFHAPYVAARLEGAREAVTQHALDFSCFDLEPRGHQKGKDATIMKRATNWLRSLDPPFGVIAAADNTGLDVLNALRTAEITVPEEAAVISIGGDNVLCPFSDPALSSVVLPGERVGYEAASLLDRLMAKQAINTHAPIAPSQLQVRRSSDMIATDDKLIRQAIRFIRDHADEPIQVGDVLAAIPLSRRPLEIRFKNATGRTLQKEILRVRLERAKELLTETDLPVAEIAIKCGFTEPQRLTEVFRRELDLSPGAFRQSRRIERS